jgi:hypothetical protein
MLIMGQMTVPTSVTPLFSIPPGAVSVNWYNLSTANTIWLGMSTALTTGNGLAVHTVPMSFQGYMTSKGGQVYGLSTNATSVINYLILTDQ